MPPDPAPALPAETAETPETPVAQRGTLPAARHHGIGARVGRAGHSSLLPLLVLWGAVIVYFGLSEPHFLTSANATNMLEEKSILFVVALAETVIVLMGSIDLSVGGLVALSSLILTTGNHGVPGGLAALLTIAFAAVISVGFNGVPIGALRMNPFVVTLGMAAVFRGVANVITGGNTEVLNHPALLGALASNQVGPIPVAVIVMAVALGFFWYLLRYTYFGRNVYAVGGNQEAAALAGISVARVRIVGFLLLGAAAGVSTLLSAGQLASVAPSVAQGLELNAIAAVLLGGTTLIGGKGGVVGTAVAVLFLGTVQNGLDLSGVSSFWQDVVTGSILVIAVGFDQLRERFFLARQAKGQS